LKNRDYLRSDNQLDSMVSRESSFLFNNLILLVAGVAVLSGSLFPVFSEWIEGTKISVGAPFFNKVNIPIGLFLLFLTGVGPLLAWRRTSFESLKRNFGGPLLGGLVAGGIAFPLGLRNFYSLVCLILSVFVTLTIFSEFFRGARVIHARTGSNFFSSVGQLTMRNTRRYGGYVVHFGMVLIFTGLSGTAFNQDKQQELSLGQSMNMGQYRLVLQSFDTRPEKNYSAERAIMEVMKGNQQVMMLYPERRFFPTNEESGTMVAIYSTLREDLYVVYTGRSPENQKPVIHAYLNPLVKWVWLGGAIVVLGTFLALVPNRQAVLVMRAATLAVPAGPAPQPVITRASSYESSD
jgi:cytochrome c-type biogenesis protein CcmF